MPWDYASNAPLPANGQPRTAANLAAVWTYQATVYNAFEAATNNTLATATAIGSLANKGLLAAFDATGGMQFAYAQINPVAGLVPGVNVVAPTGYTGTPFQYSLNGTARFSVDYLGNVTANSFIGTSSVVPADNSVTGGYPAAGVKLQPFTIQTINRRNLGVQANGTLTLTVLPGTYWGTNGTLVSYAGGTYTYGAGGNLAVPGAGAARYDLFTITDAGVLTATAGAAGGTDLPSAYPLRAPLTPALGRPLGYIGLRGATTAINQQDSGVAGTGYVLEARDDSFVGLAAVSGTSTQIANGGGTVAIGASGGIVLTPAAGQISQSALPFSLTGTAGFSQANGQYTPNVYAPFTMLSGATSVLDQPTNQGNRPAILALHDSRATAAADFASILLRLVTTAKTNPSNYSLSKTSLVIHHFTPPDNGADASAQLILEAGGASALTVYKYTQLRPDNTWGDYFNSPQGAIEAATDGGSQAILAMAGAMFGNNLVVNVSMTIAAAASDTQINVQGTSVTGPLGAMPFDPAPGWIRISNATQYPDGRYEDIYYTSMNSTQFNGCVRGACGETPQAWAIGSMVQPTHASTAVVARVSNGASIGFCAAPGNSQFDSYRVAYAVGGKALNAPPATMTYRVMMDGSIWSTGNGQPSVTPSTTGAKGGSITLIDQNYGANSGGAAFFGALSGQFAVIKGLLQQSTNNYTGHLMFSTRAVDTDTTLTERMRVTSQGVSFGAGTAQITKMYKVTGTWNPGSVATGATVTATTTVTGANPGDTVWVSHNNIPVGGVDIYGQVTSTNTVTSVIRNESGSTATINGTLTVIVMQTA